MQWKQVAIDDLRRYQYLTMCMDSIPRRIEALEYAIESIKGPAISTVPIHGSGISQYEEKLLDNIVEKERLEMQYKVNMMLVELTEKGLSALDDTERLVLERFYINRSKNHVESLMKELNYEKSQIYEIKDRALYKFTKAQYGIDEL